MYIYLYYHTDVLPAFIFGNHVPAVTAGARRGRRMPWNWSFRWLLSAMWVLGTECSMHALSARAAGLLSTESSLQLLH